MPAEAYEAGEWIFRARASTVDPSGLINLDLRWIDIETDANVDGEKIGTVSIDPMVYRINLC
jgi:outer membrane protein W